ncbi:hypothetical protein AYI68_g8168 [Smittium mucronatum]|uniref:Major facilitator superfamily (MFS) profile domain-containing protein n=1 Tax=Smittium mucronatum TaxID=133383 RepID=A0A1R0GLN6_9FUNG|nr:hypothetical protein AYI68_g8168 [Smittium mucronatum]
MSTAAGSEVSESKLESGTNLSDSSSPNFSHSVIEYEPRLILNRGNKKLYYVLTSMWTVIISYALSATGSIGIATVTNILILEAFPPEKRTFYFSIASVVHNLGSIVGPLVAPALIPLYDYRAMFMLLSSLSALGWAICFYCLHKADDSRVRVQKWKNFDYISGVLLIFMIPSFVFFLNGVPGNSVFPKAAVIVFGCLFLVSFSVFIFNGLRTKKNSVIPLV